ncbi:DNA-binding protein, partial [Limosilactobacillus vaginalis]|nr:DNA-binding protein [Limosilactobacillus vaginalis]
LFPPTQSNQQKEKIQSADEQLQSQFYQRHEEYHTFKSIYNACFIVVMMIWGCLFPLIHSNALSSILGVLWIGGWMIFAPLKREIVIKKIGPKLDAKYPLTVNRIDKNKKVK